MPSRRASVTGSNLMSSTICGAWERGNGAIQLSVFNYHIKSLFSDDIFEQRLAAFLV